MQNIFNQDFREFIEALNTYNVEYILVGGYAVILHGYLRTTGDLDIWLNRTEANYLKFIKAGNSFGLPTSQLSVDKFLSNFDIDVFSFGRPPMAIDIMLEVKGLNFKESFEKAQIQEVEGLSVNLIWLPHLITSKRASARGKDLVDVEYLDQEE